MKMLHEKVSSPRYSLFEEMSEKYQGRIRKTLVIVFPISLLTIGATIVVTIFTEKYPVIAVPAYFFALIFVFVFVISSTKIKINNVRKLLVAGNNESLIKIIQSTRKDSKKGFAIFALIDLKDKKIEEVLLQEEIDSFYFRFYDDFLYAKEVYAITRGYKSFANFESEN
jgi:hypothetical protein